MNPRSIKSACVAFKNGSLYTGAIHAHCIMDAIEKGEFTNDEEAWDAILTEGFITHGGEVLNRADAYARAAELKSFDKEAYDNDVSDCRSLCHELETYAYEMAGGALG